MAVSRKKNRTFTVYIPCVQLLFLVYVSASLVPPPPGRITENLLVTIFHRGALCVHTVNKSFFSRVKASRPGRSSAWASMCVNGSVGVYLCVLGENERDEEKERERGREGGFERKNEVAAKMVGEKDEASSFLLSRSCYAPVSTQSVSSVGKDRFLTSSS